MNYKISEVAEQTGVSVHSLRQWAKRYEVEASYKSEGGQRLYSYEDVQRIKLMNAGKARGMSLAELAQLSLETLELLLAKPTQPFVVSVYGRSLRKLKACFPKVHWLNFAEKQLKPANLAIIEEATVTEELINFLPPCQAQQGYLFCRFISRNHQKKIEALGYQVVNQELTLAWLAEWLNNATDDRFFSPHELQQLIATKPLLDCECPNHIAAVLERLQHFAEYSLECEVMGQEQAWIHQQVFTHIQQAQLEVEKALQLVIHEEGL